MALDHQRAMSIKDPYFELPDPSIRGLRPRAAARVGPRPPRSFRWLESLVAVIVIMVFASMLSPTYRAYGNLVHMALTLGSKAQCYTRQIPFLPDRFKQKLPPDMDPNTCEIKVVGAQAKG